MNAIASHYQSVRERVASACARAGRAVDDVTLIAVSKVQPLEALIELYGLGHRDFGENYVQELVAKAEAFAERGLTGVRWHFIGHLQTNKVKALMPHVASVHTVDSERLAEELARRWTGPLPLPVFIEVNIDGEASKAGVAPAEARALAEKVAGFGHLSLKGLMCVPAADVPGDSTRRSFRALRELEAGCRPLTSGALSMGMSGDFELAIEEGATHVRVGTLLFGKRPPA